MKSKYLNLLAPLSLGVLIASTAQAATVLNHSFETVLGNNNPDSWVVTETTGDGVFVRGANQYGPTDGNRVLMFDHRGPNTTQRIHQQLGDVATLGLSAGGLMTFNARFGGAGFSGGNPTAPESTEGAGLRFAALWETSSDAGTTWSIANSWVTPLGSIGTGREILKYTELAPAPTTATMADAANMQEWTLALPAGLGGSDLVRIAYEWRVPGVDNGAQYDSRIAVDNVRVEVVPEPSSMILLGAGMLGLLARRRRA